MSTTYISKNMMKKEQNNSESEKRKLITVSSFHKAVMDDLYPDNDDDAEMPRHLKEKAGVLEYLFYYACIKDDVASHEKSKYYLPLLAYTSFISSNSDFPYNWSYLIKKNEQFGKYLIRFKTYIELVTDDLSYIMERLDDVLNISFHIDGIFIAYLNKQDKSVNFECKTEIDSIHNIYAISDESYVLKVSVKNAFIGEYRIDNASSTKDKIIEEIRRYSNVQMNENQNENERQ